MGLNVLLQAKGRKFAFINVRSLLPNINLLRHDFELTDLTAIGVSESWLNHKVHDSLFKINGFNLVRLDRMGGKRGGGLVLYINNVFNFECLPDKFNYSDPDLEMLTVLVKPPNQKNFLLSLIYVPPLWK